MSFTNSTKVLAFIVEVEALKFSIIPFTTLAEPPPDILFIAVARFAVFLFAGIVPPLVFIAS